jgi:hypothetical protein
MLINCPGCERCKQIFETASHVLCECEALVVLRCWYLCLHFWKSSDFAGISLVRYRTLLKVTVVPTLIYYVLPHSC